MSHILNQKSANSGCSPEGSQAANPFFRTETNNLLPFAENVLHPDAAAQLIAADLAANHRKPEKFHQVNDRRAFLLQQQHQSGDFS